MKTQKRFLMTGLAVALALPVFQGCKKGEGDPFLSLSSRKARLAGEWTVSQWTEESTFTNSSNSGNSSSGFDKMEIEDDDVTVSSNYKSSGPFGSFEVSMTGSGDAETTITIEKDGTFTRKYELKNLNISEDGYTYTMNSTVETSGTWDFLNGTGKDFKNKERIVLLVEEEKYTNTMSDGTSTESENSVYEYANGSYSEVWQITTLKNKELVIEGDRSGKSNYTYTSNTGGANSSESGTSSTEGSVKGILAQD